MRLFIIHMSFLPCFANNYQFKFKPLKSNLILKYDCAVTAVHSKNAERSTSLYAQVF